MARTSRWDRPSPPHDLRWFVRLFGKTLIVVGLLMFGFVAYQLWGTGIEYARAQDEGRDDFEELLERAGRTSTSESVTPPTTDPLATTSLPTSTAASVASVSVASSDPGATTVAPTTTSTVAPTTTSSAPPLDIADLGITEGDAVAWLRIPRIGLDDIVFAGVGREELKKGPGHYPQTPMPGQLGNSAIAGHRTTFGGPFLHIDELEPGDEILIGTPYGDFVYLTTTTEIVSPDAWEVIATTDPTVATLTLTSCHPVGTASERIIVHAELDPLRSPAPGPAVYNYGRGASGGPTGELPGDEPQGTPAATGATTTATTATTAPATPATEVAGSPATTASSTSTTAPAPPQTLPADPLYSVVPGGGTIGGGDGGGNGDAAEDAFGNHWFDDSDAWPQVALWGVAATAVVVGAYLLARSTRNSWIGLAAGALPFLVTLYFFYQNVNRLLPAAL